MQGNTFTRFLDGALSGFISGAVLQPLQVIKTSMQVSPIDKPGAGEAQAKGAAFEKIIEKSGRQHYELLTFRQATQLIYSREGI